MKLNIVFHIKTLPILSANVMPKPDQCPFAEICYVSPYQHIEGYGDSNAMNTAIGMVKYWAQII